MSKLVIIGAGGHGRVVASIATACAQLDTSLSVTGFIDDEDKALDGYTVVGNDGAIASLVEQGKADSFIIGLGSIKGGAGIRQKLFAMCKNAGLEAHTLIHPSAILSQPVSVGVGTAIMAGAVINPGTQIGQNVIINTRAGIDHDCHIGDHSHIAPGCTLSGDVKIGSASLIGVGTTIRQGVTIGDNVTIGAGSVIVGDIPDNQTAFGVPAKVIS